MANSKKGASKQWQRFGANSRSGHSRVRASLFSAVGKRATPRGQRNHPLSPNPAGIESHR
jgi:hypothetical protein